MSTDLWSHTLLLPTYSMPARAGLARREPETLARWGQRDLLGEQERDPDRPESFVLHDGPPYANGPAHVGHLLNKCLKDFVVRSRSLQGKCVSLVYGWDCHGLPVERSVLDARPALADAPLSDRRAAFRAWALKWQCHQSARFHRSLALHGRDTYRTLDPSYEASVLEVFADLVEHGLVYRAMRPVRWSLNNRTALAEAALVFGERTDSAVWVDFAAVDPRALQAAFGLDGDQPVAFTAWTTAPWTLPANLALGVNPEGTYALVGGDRLRVVAEDAVGRLSTALGRAVDVLGRCSGAALVTHRYRSPLTSVTPKGGLQVLAAFHVNVVDGSGLVHLAPGHGPEDHQVCQRVGLDPYCPLRDDGRLDATVPQAAQGLTPEQADPVVTELLRQRGALAAAHDVTHTVALDWRGGGRVVYRATPQWFVALDRPMRAGPTLRQAALDALCQVAFHPASGRQRLQSMVQSRPDWCVSRQRAWGLPLPVFYDEQGEPVLDAEMVRAVASVVRREGANAWVRQSAAALLQDWGGSAKGLAAGSDVLDVWFESGASWRAVLGQPSADLVLEGSDQHRGWFQSSLLLAVACTGKAPYRHVVTHGFVVDKRGRKLSKALGNAPDVDNLVETHGAEVLRWWAATCRFEAEVKADDALFRAAGREFRKVRDTLRYLVGNLGDYSELDGASDLRSGATVEAWLLHQWDGLVDEVRAAYGSYACAAAARALHRFCADVLSAKVLPAYKDRLYCDAVDSPRRRQAQQALFEVCDGFCRLLAPLLPHTADEVWRALNGCVDDPLCTVHVHRFPVAGRGPRHPAVVGALTASRAAALAALETARNRGGPADPVDAELVLGDPAGHLASFDSDDLASWCGVSRVCLEPSATAVDVVDLRDRPRCERSRRRTADVRRRSSGAWLSDRDAAVVADP